jgi:hypothetical protein
MACSPSNYGADAGHALEQIILGAPHRAVLNLVGHGLGDVVELALELPDVLLDALPDVLLDALVEGPRGKAEPVLLRHQHLEQLALAGQQGVQQARGLVGQRPRRWARGAKRIPNCNPTARKRRPRCIASARNCIAELPDLPSSSPRDVPAAELAPENKSFRGQPRVRTGSTLYKPLRSARFAWSQSYTSLAK